MKILVISDLHNEMGHWLPSPQELPVVDAVVLAGDIHKAARAPGWIRSVWPDLSTPVVYVAGNHEHWGSDIMHNLDKIKAESKKHGVVFLENGEFVMPDPADGHLVRFLGCTLWTSFGDDVERGINMSHITTSGFPDFVYTRKGGKRFTTGDAYVMHLNSLRFLTRHMEDSFEGKTVVVTHHCPCEQSIPKRFLGDPCNSAFTTDLTQLIDKYKPNVWIHGHTHDEFDYEVYHTRVVCNPADYPARRVNKYGLPGMLGNVVSAPRHLKVIEV